MHMDGRSIVQCLGTTVRVYTSREPCLTSAVAAKTRYVSNLSRVGATRIHYRGLEANFCASSVELVIWYCLSEGEDRAEDGKGGP